MEFTDLLDEYLELKKKFDEDKLSEIGCARYHEIRDALNARILGEIVT